MNNNAQMPMTPRNPAFDRARLKAGAQQQAAPPEQPINLPPIPVDRLLTTRQVAKILGVSIETLKKWRQRHKHLDFVRFPDGCVRYKLSVVTKFIDEWTFKIRRDSDRW